MKRLHSLSIARELYEINMVPVDAIAAGTTVQNTERTATQNGKMYALNLQTLAEQQNRLYGSGGGRWFTMTRRTSTRQTSHGWIGFRCPRRSMRLLTGKVAHTAGTLDDSILADTPFAYARLAPKPGGHVWHRPRFAVAQHARERHGPRGPPPRFSNTSAVVTKRVTRPGAFGTLCAVP